MKIKVAAVQMCAVLADVAANLQKAEDLVIKAASRGAEVVILPEFFVSACAFHPAMMNAVLPLDGEVTSLLKQLACKYEITIGGSFIAHHGDNNFNTFILVNSDGEINCHNKDIPTMWENCYYIGGNDNGVLETNYGPVGVALCWEMLRTQTVKRLINKVRFVVSGSCWWDLPESAPKSFDRLREKSLQLLQSAPVDFAKILGVPVIHAGHAGNFMGFAAPSEKKSYVSRYLGESKIVDSNGAILAKLKHEDGEGIIVAGIEVSEQINPSMAMPDEYWIPNMPKEFLIEWDKLNKFGKEYYKNNTVKKLH